MKRFSEYLNEDFDTAVYNSDGGISINDPSVVDGINANLERTTARPFRTPYNALEEIRKIFAYYKIFLPNSVFLDQTDGNDVFEISQFGEKTGITDRGEVVTANNSPLFVYFEWSVNDHGMYDIFCAVVNSDELDEIMDDYNSEIGNDEDLKEASMPDLKKKMGANKVTLPNMMKKEETEQLDELHRKSKEAIKKIKSRLEKKHDEKWTETQEKRKKNKSSGPGDTRGEDKERNSLAKRWLRADKAEKKLEK